MGEGREDRREGPQRKERGCFHLHQMWHDTRPGRGSHMNLRPETIRKEVEESLARLQTDHIDLYQMHDVDPDTPIEDSWREIYKLIDEGKVRYAGLSNPSHPTRRARHEDRPRDLPAGTVQSPP